MGPVEPVSHLHAHAAGPGQGRLSLPRPTEPTGPALGGQPRDAAGDGRPLLGLDPLARLEAGPRRARGGAAPADARAPAGAPGRVGAAAQRSRGPGWLPEAAGDAIAARARGAPRRGGRIGELICLCRGMRGKSRSADRVVARAARAPTALTPAAASS